MEINSPAHWNPIRPSETKLTSNDRGIRILFRFGLTSSRLFLAQQEQQQFRVGVLVAMVQHPLW
uniref:Uncharacterized protein n=1 Tax=Oryza rufipogon TaxID=4529 RepID=A0A0E0P6S8_ORYRU